MLAASEREALRLGDKTMLLLLIPSRSLDLLAFGSQIKTKVAVSTHLARSTVRSLCLPKKNKPSR